MVVDSVLLTSDRPAPARSFRSRAAHAGEDASSPSRPLSAPIHQNSVYAISDSKLADAAFANVIHDLKTIPFVPSVGGTTTTVSFPPLAPTCLADGAVVARAYASKTIRLSIDLEDSVDIIADLRLALDRALANQNGKAASNGSTL